MSAMKRFLLFLLTIVSISADIQIIDSFDRLDFQVMDHETLVIFDVDDVLIMAEDQLLQPPSWNQLYRLAGPLFQKGHTFPLSLLYTETARRVIDPSIIATIQDLQARGVPVIALTSCATGAFGHLSNIQKWRIDDLRKLGFDFSHAFAGCHSFVFNELQQSGAPAPLFEEGILFSKGYTKGEVLSAFLERQNLHYSTIYFLDDLIENLLTVEEAAKARGSHFKGYQYVGAIAHFKPVDPLVIQTQWNHLLEKNEWLTDKQVEERLYRSSRKQIQAALFVTLDGAYPLPFLLKMASPQKQKTLLTVLESVRANQRSEDVRLALEAVAAIMNKDWKVRKGVKALCQQLHDEGVYYTEIHVPLHDLGKGMDAYLSSIEKALDKSPVTAWLILSIPRDSSAETLEKAIQMAQEHTLYVQGIALTGDGSIEALKPALPKVHKAKVPLFLSLGETELDHHQLEVLKTVHPSRVLHGYFLQNDAAAWMQARYIPLETTLSGATVNGYLNQTSLHPVFSFLQKGRIMLGAEYPLIYSTHLAKELYLFGQIADSDRLEGVWRKNP